MTSAKRLLTSPGLNALGLKDRRDITRLVAQSALQVSPDHMNVWPLLDEIFAVMHWLRVCKQLPVGMLCVHCMCSSSFWRMTVTQTGHLVSVKRAGLMQGRVGQAVPVRTP